MPYILTVLTLVVIGVGFTLLQSSSSTEEFSENIEITRDTDIAVIEEEIVTTRESQTDEVISGTEDVVVQSAAVYKDGLYTEVINYRTPAGSYQMTLSVTIANDTVVDSSISYNEEAAKSKYSTDFESTYRNEVIGKDISTIELSRVGGASITTNTFNRALSNIKEQAS